jgi:predicted naringenin-chalcone synthase
VTISAKTGYAHPCAIAATATAVPPHTITREDLKFYMGKVFDIPERRLEAMMSIVDNANVNKRHSIFPVEYFVEPRPLSQTNNEYIEHAIKLGFEATQKCLERAGMKAEDIDLIITVSCTGFMIPSLDAHMINELGFRSDVRRMPFTELGCAAGAMALSRAADFIQAYPGRNVLIVSVELPTLTFQRKDISQANLISSILFGDGAAALVEAGIGDVQPGQLCNQGLKFKEGLQAPLACFGLVGSICRVEFASTCHRIHHRGYEMVITAAAQETNCIIRGPGLPGQVLHMLREFDFGKGPRNSQRLF